jgi:hypothetical protein
MSVPSTIEVGADTVRWVTQGSDPPVGSSVVVRELLRLR